MYPRRPGIHAAFRDPPCSTGNLYRAVPAAITDVHGAGVMLERGGGLEDTGN